MRKENYSNAIAKLRFPLIVVVVLIHCNISDYNVAVGHLYGYKWFRLIAIHLVADVAVPAFFFIAGYLLYANIDFTWNNYVHKLRNRMKTLLVPYLMWNTICFLLIVVLQLIKPDFRLLFHKSVSDMQLKDFFLIYWDLGQIESLSGGRPGPILGPLWFLKDLMILVVLSPLLHYPLRHLKWCWPVLLALLCITPLPYQQSVIQDPSSVLFFTLGMAFSYSHISLDMFDRHRVRLSLFALASMVFIVLAVVTPLTAWMPPLARRILMNVAILIEQFAFMMAAFAWVANSVPADNTNGDEHPECWEDKLRLSESSFFIFCMHPFVSSVFMNISKLDLPIFHSSSLSILFVLLAVIITMIICLIVFHVMRRYFPRLLLLVTGSRS
jgi:hypothetical protein